MSSSLIPGIEFIQRQNPLACAATVTLNIIRCAIEDMESFQLFKGAHDRCNALLEHGGELVVGDVAGAFVALQLVYLGDAQQVETFQAQTEVVLVDSEEFVFHYIDDCKQHAENVVGERGKDSPYHDGRKE